MGIWRLSFLDHRILTPPTCLTVNHRRQDFLTLRQQLVAAQNWGHSFVPITIPQGYGHLRRASHQEAVTAAPASPGFAAPVSPVTSHQILPSSAATSPLASSRRSSPAPTFGVPLLEWEYRHDIFVHPRVPCPMGGMTGETLHNIIEFVEFFTDPANSARLQRSADTARELLQEMGDPSGPKE